MLGKVRSVVFAAFLAGPLLAFTTCPSIVQGQDAKLAALLERSPASANAIAYFHAPSLKKLMSEAGLPLKISDQVAEAWLVSDLDIISLTPAWEAGYATVGRDVDANKLAKAFRGYVDMVGDTEVVWTPRESYLIPIAGQRVGFLRPARRSLLAKWVNSTPNSALAPAYLLSQAKQNENFLSLLFAVNLENAISEVALSPRLDGFESLAKADKPNVAKTLASVRGLSIIIGRRSLSECILSVEFSQPPTDLVPFAGALLSDILNRNGSAAPETLDWKVSVEGNRLSFKGAISADSLDSILGIFSINGHAEQLTQQLDATEALSDGRGSDSQVATASKEYFDKTNEYIERVRNYKAQNTGFRAKWDDQIARRIDELGTLNVDPQLIDYGANIAGILRNNAIAIRGGNVSAGQMQAEQVRSGGYVNGYYGGYGGYRDANSIALDQGVTSSQQRMAGFGSYAQAISEIDKLTGEIRRAMTDKFQIQF